MTVKITGGGGGGGTSLLQIDRPVANPAFLAAWGFDQYHISPVFLQVAAGAALATDIIRICPYIAVRTATLDRIQCELTVVGGAGSLARLALYNSDPASLYPTSLLIDSGPFAMDAGVGFKPQPIVAAVVAGRLYWMAYNVGVAAAPTVRNGNTITFPLWYPNAPGANSQVCASIPFVFAAFPAVFPAGATPLTPASVPVIGVRYSS